MDYTIAIFETYTTKSHVPKSQIPALQGIFDHFLQEALVLSSNFGLDALGNGLSSVLCDVGLFDLAHNFLVLKDGTSQGNLVCNKSIGQKHTLDTHSAAGPPYYY
jgi:hypothetical protein